MCNLKIFTRHLLILEIQLFTDLQQSIFISKKIIGYYNVNLIIKLWNKLADIQMKFLIKYVN